jgi:uncharacterized repeat protein (TIGR01451 family)
MRTGRHVARWVRLALQGVLAIALGLVGLVAFGTAVASAHNNAISGKASCATPLGTGYTVTWTISNDWDESESGTVTAVTGGLATLNSSTFTIGVKDPPSGNKAASSPNLTATLTQTLPATASGSLTLSTTSTWSDGTVVKDSGTANLAGLNCAAPPVQTIAGHIYLCNDSVQTTTEESGGDLSASGPSSVASGPNPLAPTSVEAGGYTMTASPPSGFTLVACGGSSTPNSGGTSATESVTVPSGGAGVGIFYVTPVVVPVTQTIAGHIYLCSLGSQTVTEVSGGALSAGGPSSVASGPNPLAPTSVDAGDYTMTASSPAGYYLVACGGSATPNELGTSATDSVTVPSGGAGVGIFYVTLITQTIAGHIYLCDGSTPTTTEVSGGELSASGPSTVGGVANPMAATEVEAGDYTMTAAAPSGDELVTCGGTSTPNPGGTSATEPVNVPAGGAGVGIFYVVALAPGISVVKSSTTPSYSAVGDVIAYDFLVTNTGNVNLDNVSVADVENGSATQANLSAITCPVTTLTPGASETCTAAYTVSQPDLNAGSVNDTAAASGTPPGSTTPVTSPPSSTTVPVASISILKQVCGSLVATDCSAGGAGPWTQSAVVPTGDTAYWRITVTNTGESALAGVSVSDPLVAACDSAPSTVDLAVGASVSFYCASPDITASLDNVATTTFTNDHGPPPSSSAQVTTLPPVTSATSTGGPVTSATTITATGSPEVSTAVAPAVTG